MKPGSRAGLASTIALVILFGGFLVDIPVVNRYGTAAGLIVFFSGAVLAYGFLIAFSVRDPEAALEWSWNPLYLKPKRNTPPSPGDDEWPALPDEDMGPLAYPGNRPSHPAVLLSRRCVLPLRPSPEPLGTWPAGQEPGWPLDELLARQESPPMRQRQAVLAAGSSAAPAWLAGWFADAGRRATVPIMSAQVYGLVAGVSAHPSSRGFLPAVPAASRGAVSTMWVIWLDDDGLALMDRGEPDCRRVRLPPTFQVVLTGGWPVAQCWVYAPRAGCLAGEPGGPRELAAQADLISGLLAQVPGLARVAGASPGEWIHGMREPAVREQVTATLTAAGLVRPALGTAG